ncbi:carbohydrate-binding module family 1 protein [Xylariaceae sp. FL0016]|nr:carbohydrate-binding module family 1 protein [Xylariaceae sp. FL0016]
MTVLGRIAALCHLATLVASQTSITVNVGTQYQQIDGFGFSQAFGRATEFQNAGSSTQKAALDYLFSTSTGAGFSIIRNRIGSGGSGDSIEPNSPGSPSSTPTYVWDANDSGQVWFTKQAVSYGVKTIYADAWSAPGFMKTSGSESTAGYLCGSTGHTCSSGNWQQAYANFLVKYVQLYASAGYTITHLGFLNEPDYQTSYSQMQISSNAQEAISFIPILYNTVKAAGLSTELTCCDAVGWTMQGTYTTALVNAGSTQYLNVITSHSYSADATTPLSQTSLRKWNTEGGPSSAFTTTWYSSGADNEGFTWANKIAVAMVNAQLSAYLFWEGFEIKQTQSGSHLVDATDGTNVTPSGIFWAFAMWSRHIRPGAHRVATSGSIGSVIIGAFQNSDGSVVVVFTNSGGSSQSAKISFSGFTAGAAAAWVTSQGSTFATTTATLSGGAVTVAVPAHGVVTVKLTASGNSGGAGTTTLATSTTTAPASTNTASCASLYAQCGGSGWSGSTCCASGSCTYSNDYYSQCL